MKISKKLIGITVASLGMVFSIGGAIALYQTGAENTGFGISAGAYAGSGGTVTYKINDTAGNSTLNPVYMTSGGEDGGTGLSTTYTQVVYEGTLSATFANELNPQDFVVGNLSVSVNNIAEAYRGHLAIWVDVDGYVDASLGKYYYEHFMEHDYQITNEVQSYSDSKNIAVSSNGVQKVRVFLKFDLGSYNLLEKNEANLEYSVAIQWGAANNEFVAAYVVGDRNQWTVDDEFMMAPNINKAYSEGWEWYYSNLPGTLGDAKCQLKNGAYSGGEDFSLDPAKTYNVYWDGNNEHAANFAEID